MARDPYQHVGNLEAPRTPADVLARARRAGQPIPAGEKKTRTLSEFSPRFFPPPGSQFFNKTGYNDFAAAGTVSPAALQFTVPEGFLGVIKTFSAYQNDAVATSDIHWSILLNGIAAPGYDDITMFPRLAGFASVGDDIAIDLREDMKVSISIRKVDAAVQKVGAAVTGWFYPKDYQNIITSW